MKLSYLNSVNDYEKILKRKSSHLNLVTLDNTLFSSTDLSSYGRDKV